MGKESQNIAFIAIKSFSFFMISATDFCANFQTLSCKHVCLNGSTEECACRLGYALGSDKQTCHGEQGVQGYFIFYIFNFLSFETFYLVL